VRNLAFLSHVNIKAIFLPRQARDKHRENSKKEITLKDPLVCELS
jgi:hypothetical protein